MSNKETDFKVNQKIVYPSQGVGKIIEIREKKFKDSTLLYYVVYLEVSDMTVMIPVNRCSELGVRAIVSAEEAQKAIDMIGDEFEPVTSDWKLRYQMNLELLKKGTVSDIASIVRCLYHRSKVKELPIQERKLYDSAKKLLEDEVSFALNITQKEVEALIHAKLEPLGLQKDNKATNNDDNEFLDGETEEFIDDSIAEDEEIDDDDDDSDDSE